jgi:glycolate oxidase subunit GlcD
MIDLPRLAAIVGAENVLASRELTYAYECDGLTHLRSRPAAVVLPASTAEVAAIVRLLAGAGVPFVARGAGTGLSGGALCPRDGVVIETARLRAIRRIDPDRRLAEVECGVTNAAVSVAARPFGLFYAPDPSSQAACTIGGNVAENSGGPHCFKYGATARHVLGLEVVLPDGEILVTGSPLGEEPGLDLTGILVGSEGTCGIVTAATLRLVPLPESTVTLLAVFATVEIACAAVTRIVASGLEPSALEILDRLTIDAVEASVYAAGYPRDAGAVLLIEFDGAIAATSASATRVESLCRELAALRVEQARDEASRLKLWKGRKGAFGAMGRLAPDLYVQDAVVPRSKLPQVLAQVVAIGAKYRIRLSNVFHAGDGNLHPNVSFDRRDEDETARVVAAGKEILAACVAAGGSLSGEHGIGVEKRDYMPMVFTPESLDKMRAVHDAFNPRGLLNPDKVLPATRSCVEAKGSRLALDEAAQAGAPHGAPS